MWTAIAILVLAIVFVAWRLLRTILRPIFTYIHQAILNLLTKTGISRDAARALLSVIIIVIIIIIIL